MLGLYSGPPESYVPDDAELTAVDIAIWLADQADLDHGDCIPGPQLVDRLYEGRRLRGSLGTLDRHIRRLRYLLEESRFKIERQVDSYRLTASPINVRPALPAACGQAERQLQDIDEAVAVFLVASARLWAPPGLDLTPSADEKPRARRGFSWSRTWNRSA